jgi:hypothetical protein
MSFNIRHNIMAVFPIARISAFFLATFGRLTNQLERRGGVRQMLSQRIELASRSSGQVSRIPPLNRRPDGRMKRDWETYFIHATA